MSRPHATLYSGESALGSIRVKYLGWLAERVGREVEVRVDGEAVLEEVIKLPPDVDLDDLVVLVNGKPAKRGQKVRPGDQVSVMPHVSGGQIAG